LHEKVLLVEGVVKSILPEQLGLLLILVPSQKSKKFDYLFKKKLEKLLPTLI